MKPTFLLILTLGILSAAEVKLPPPFQTPSSTNRPRVIAKPEGAQLRVPQGFRVEEFASDLSKPRIMLYTPTGEILVTESIPNGRVTVLYDKNNDFKADTQRKVLLQGLDRPYGMAFWKDYLYVAETTSLKRYKYDREGVDGWQG